MQVSVNGITREMLPGDAVFYMPDTPHEYIYFVDEEHPVCQSLYIHFSGSSAKEAVESAGIKDSCFAPSVGRRLGRLIVSLITDYRVGNKLSACGQLLSILPLLTKKSTSSPSENLQRIHRQVEYIGIHFAEEIDLDKCAAKEGLSRSRFSHIFTDYMGVSPYKYQLSLRLDKAKELLLESSLSVGEISASVGFSDPLYFSRLFRKNFGISPSKFKVKNNQDG
jgi:AraC-like DNA-binding protein